LIAYLHRSRDELEEAQRRAQDERKQLEADRRALQTEWVERQRKRIADLEGNFLEAQKRLEGEVARLAADIKDRTLRAQLETQSGKRIRKITREARSETDAAIVEALDRSQHDLGVLPEAPRKPLAPDELSAGQSVVVRGFKRPMIFRRHDDHTAELEAGPMRIRVPLADILDIAPDREPEGPPEGAAARSRSVTVHAQPSEEPAAEEINVIGCTVEEATRRVDKFLDQAALAAKPSVRIIHGHGTGALRRGLAQFLTSHPLVKTIHTEAEDRGGTAITVVELPDRATLDDR
jgi:DNA mismatch repair protein MutS2